MYILSLLLKLLSGILQNNPVDTGCKLNVHKTFRRRPGRLLNVLCMFNLRPVSTGKLREGVANSFLYLLAQSTVDLYLV